MDETQRNNGDVTREAPRELSRARSPQDALQPSDPPPPPKRSKSSRNGFVVLANFFMTMLVLIAAAALAGAYFAKVRFEEPGPLAAPRTIVVKEGSSLARIAEQLQSGGVIDNELIFRLGVRGHRVAGEMKAGEYAFVPGMSMREVMETLRSGKGIVYKVTIPEGYTSYQILQKLRENEVLTGELPTELPPEGSLLPDTYPFQRGTTRAQILDQMRKAQQAALATAWEKRVDGLPLASPQELVTLASIVEKETGKADERPRVAGVFINRLNKKMRLQSDPTILYGIFGSQGRPADRAILKSDIEKPTPYNTYQIDGLPPGPIANPGKAALEAVSNPSRTKEVYFVADGTGGHVFAETLDEHNDNVKRWREIEKRLREEQEKQQAAKTAAGEAQPAAETKAQQ
jgi:UPF0755 protein